MRIAHLIAGAAIALAIPAIAQTQPATPSTDVTQPPGDIGPASDAAAANGSALATVDTRETVSVRPEDQAAYDADLTAYRAALRANRRDARIDAAITERQERAYADAMHAWRIQVIDCRRGISAACRAPTPRPGDFM